MENLQGLLIEDPTAVASTTSAIWRYLMLIGAGIITGLGLVIVWFVRQALKNAAQDTESAHKLAGIRAALRRSFGLS